MQLGRLGFAGLWGLAGVLLLLGQAIYKLTPVALELRYLELGPLELAVLAGWVVMSAYSEGYRGFHRAFSPRVVARAQHLAAHPRPLFVAIAPLYCLGLVHATRKRLTVSWILTIAIIIVVIAVRQLAQPWRGIIDAGVVIGLGIGVASILYFIALALAGRVMPVSPDVPG
ncbi:MAG: hypothetical protein M3680_22965 [Myxococcota bacterium]|nr:hypothetical protein [Myxococcota bacterium]